MPGKSFRWFIKFEKFFALTSLTFFFLNEQVYSFFLKKGTFKFTGKFRGKQIFSIRKVTLVSFMFWYHK